MLSLLPRLAEVCAPFHVWGLTSLAHLWLLVADDWRSPWLVCIIAVPNEGYRITLVQIANRKMSMKKAEPLVSWD